MGGGGGGTPPRQQLTCPRHGARRDSSATAGRLRGAVHRPRIGTAASGTAPVPHRAAFPSPLSLPAPVPPRRRDGKARWKKSYGSCRRRRRGASTGPSRRAAPGPSVRARGAGGSGGRSGGEGRVLCRRRHRDLGKTCSATGGTGAPPAARGSGRLGAVVPVQPSEEQPCAPPPRSRCWLRGSSEANTGVSGNQIPSVWGCVISTSSLLPIS